MLERLGNIGLQLLVVILVVIGLWLFKSMVFGSFEITASLGFIVTAFFIAGIVMVILSTFASEAIAKKLTNAVLVILVLATGWSILVSTNEVAAEANQATVSGWYNGVSSWLFDASDYNSQAALAYDARCGQAMADKRAQEEQALLELYTSGGEYTMSDGTKKPITPEIFAAARKMINEKYENASKLCNSPGTKVSDTISNVSLPTYTTQPASSSTPQPVIVKAAPVAKVVPTYGLEFRKAYKYDNSPKVYVYDTDGKLHWLTSEMAFLNYYGCRYQPGVHINKCMTIYRMPSGVPKSMFGSDIN